MAHDIFHDAVRQGLIKDGWRITHEDMQLQVGGVEMYVDLAAEPLIAAEKEDQKIAVEVKSFVRVSDIHEFHLAIGQYRNYLLALSIRDPERVLYLAVPEEAFNRFFTLQFVQQALQFNQVYFLVYNAQEAKIVLWQKQINTANIFAK
ncbi:MAG: fatty-acid oxidation protein subunit alpha [Caldilinea sp. CFX5]|nr:fatty-acid oxidation protein subunit alpha [Caldilinea sp. CFX5]